MAHHHLVKLLTFIILISSSLISYSKDRLLIMTISEYESSTLRGVKHDAENAINLADALGYETIDAVVLKDRALTADGMRGAFKTFANSIEEGDRAFIYYSGHGASYQNDQVCAQALVSQDEKLIETSELIDYIGAVKSKVSDAIVIFDACHSGGNKNIVDSRSVKSHTAGRPPLVAKVWTPKDGELCSDPINVIERSWNVSSNNKRSMTNPEFNFTFIAAANEKEVALDNSESGGLATVGLLTCADSGVKDSNGSLSIDYTEIVDCAQEYVNNKVEEINQRQLSTTYIPHTVEIYGNKERTAQVEAITDTNAPQDRAAQLIAAFQSLQANSNGNWDFNVDVAENIQIDQDFDIEYSSDLPGYIYMLYVGSDKQDMRQIWPSIGNHIQISVGSHKTPRLTMQAPAGENTVLMVVSQKPVDFSPLFNSEGAATINTETLIDINCVMQNQRNIKLKEDGDCKSTKRNIVLAEEKDDDALGAVAGYSARMLLIQGEQ